MADVVAADEGRGGDAIVGQVQLTAKDVMSAMPHLPENKLPRLLLLIVLVACVAIGVMCHADAVTIIVPSAFLLVMLSLLQQPRRKALEKRSAAAFGSTPTTFRFDDYGFSVESALSQQRMAWALLTQQLETPDSFVVYSSPRWRFVVPKRTFDASQLPRLRELLQTRIQSKPVPRLKSPTFVAVVWLAVLLSCLAIWLLLGGNTQQPRRRQGPHATDSSASAP